MHSKNYMRAIAVGVGVGVLCGITAVIVTRWTGVPIPGGVGGAITGVIIAMVLARMRGLTSRDQIE